jgi:4-methoxybenzoate monooxygenase (O-demethylating)
VAAAAAEPGLARVAFDEAVRWESPVQTFFRTATADVRVGDHVVPDGKKILTFLGAANRDPRHWATPEHPNPDAFDLGRDPSGHVGFGMGIHQCVGQHVARLESEALLAALLPRVERIELAGSTRRHHNNTLRAWESIPVRLTLAYARTVARRSFPQVVGGYSRLETADTAALRDEARASTTDRRPGRT